MEGGLVIALCLWITWLEDIPLVHSFGTDFGGIMLFATFVNLILCFLTVGLQYAIWKYYLSILLVLIAVVALFFTFFFKWG